MMILKMSLSAAVFILVIVVIRALAISKLPKKTFLALWGVALCRLLIPFSIPSHWSAYNAVSNISETFPEIRNITTVILNTTTQITASYSVPEESVNALTIPLSVSPFVFIWLTGAILMVAFFLVMHLRYRREYKTALPINDYFLNKWLAEHVTRRTVQLRQSDRISAPLTYGIWRPVILLPKVMDYTDICKLKYILTHEFIHIKRFDTLKKLLFAAALCAHWFNPCVWVMYILANRDIELSCDEAVVRTFGETMKSAYAMTLIDMEETKSTLTPLCNNFSKNAIEERITAIMRIKKTTIVSIILALALVVGTTVAFATSAVEEKALGLFEKVFDDDVHRYADNINKISEQTSMVATEDYTIYLESTLFTDNNVYAIIGLKGSIPKDFDVNGRIVYAAQDQTAYGLKGDIKEIEPVDGVQYFFYSATITESGASKSADPMLVLAAGNNFLKHNSLRDSEGKILEITISLGEKEHILTTMVANVSTEALIFHPNADLYEGDYYSTILLTPWELKMTGCSEKTYASYEEWDKLYIKVTIVLSGGKKIHLSYDSRGTVYDEGYPLGMSRGADIRTGKFYHYWDFREWKLDLSKVSALIVDGKTYRVTLTDKTRGNLK